jgi:hypothetical protein
MRPMKLCIDFGSAYTKIALRSDWDCTTKLLGDKKLNLEDLHFCVPSVVACDQRTNKTRWAWGLQAVDLKEGGGIKVFRNWKRHFFSDTPHPAAPTPLPVPVGKVDSFLKSLDALEQERMELIGQIAVLRALPVRDVMDRAQQLSVDDLRSAAGRLSPPTRAQANSQDNATIDLEIREAAVEFFRGLHAFVGQRFRGQGINDLGDVPMRLCVPAFDERRHSSDLTASEELLVEILRETGWCPDESRPVVSEPAANAIGVLTRGANKTSCRGADGDQRIINMGEMFTQGGFQTGIRNYAQNLWEHPSRQYVALMVDVGAYTTDFALVQFDLHDNDLPPTTSSRSERLGIAQLDRRVAESLPTGKQRYITSLASREFETLKRKLYPELEPYETGAGVIGEGEELTRIRECIQQFAGQVADMTRQFLCDHKVLKLDEVILTGGGNNITLIASALLQLLPERGPRLVHVPGNFPEKYPFKTTLLGQSLVRGASALGGASVFFESLEWKP